MKKKLYIALGAITLFSLQGCFFAGLGDAAYGLYLIVLPFLFISGLIFFVIVEHFLKNKKDRLPLLLWCLFPFLFVYIFTTIDAIPGHIRYTKQKALRAKESKAKEPKTTEIKNHFEAIFPNIPDDEIILFQGTNSNDNKNFVVLKRDSETDRWDEDYRFSFDIEKKSQGCQALAGNNKFLVSYFHDYGHKDLLLHDFLTVFMKNEKWEVINTIEHPFSETYVPFGSQLVVSLAVFDDFLAVATTHNKKSAVSIYKMSENELNFIQTIDVADSSRKSYTFTTKVFFHKDELIIADGDFNNTNNNATYGSADFDGSGKLIFYLFKNGKFQESQTIIYSDIPIAKYKKWWRLGCKIESVSDDCLIVKDANSNKVAIKKVNNKWQYDEKLSLEIKSSEKKSSVYSSPEYDIYRDYNRTYTFNENLYAIDTYRIKNKQNGNTQSIVLNPDTEKFYTIEID